MDIHSSTILLGLLRVASCITLSTKFSSEETGLEHRQGLTLPKMPTCRIRWTALQSMGRSLSSSTMEAVHIFSEVAQFSLSKWMDQTTYSQTYSLIMPSTFRIRQLRLIPLLHPWLLKVITLHRKRVSLSRRLSISQTTCMKMDWTKRRMSSWCNRSTRPWKSLRSSPRIEGKNWKLP